MESIDKLDLKSLNISEDKKAKLKELFPEVFSEDKIDFDKLKLTLGEDIADSEERFGLQWAGKKDCFKVIQEPSVGTLKPCKEESVNWDTTENLFIEGDNLEVLKQLQKAYYGKVKMIYIDPPYNTGGEFIYPDRFQENLDTYLAYTGQVNDEGKKFSTNTETSGRFHSNWLNMIYPRLFLAKNLLKDDGVIFLSIDDNEADNLKKLCNEIFGEENFIAKLIWSGGRKNDSKYISISHEYVLCYFKNIQLIKDNKTTWREKKQGLNDIYKKVDELIKKNNNDFKLASIDLKKWYKSLDLSNPILKNAHYDTIDKIGIYYADNISWPGGGGPKFDVLHPVTNKPVKIPSRGWLFSSPDRMNEFIMKDLVKFGEDENSVPTLKAYLKDREYQVPYSVFYQDGRASTKRLMKLLGSKVFDNPKDEKIISSFIKYHTNDNDIILDFFSGSCSTAHAVLDLNKEDGGSRKFIMVQLPEPCDVKSEAFKAGYKTIADIGKERIRRVIKKIETDDQEEEIKNQGKLELEEDKPKNKLDLGFKVFKLDRSNFKIWNGNNEFAQLQEQLLKALFHIDTNSSEDDILTEILIKSGFQLTVKIEEITLAAKKVFSIADGSLIVCLDKDITKELIQEIAKLEPARVVCLDSGFKERDELKTNAIQIMKSHGVDDFRTV